MLETHIVYTRQSMPYVSCRIIIIKAVAVVTAQTFRSGYPQITALVKSHPVDGAVWQALLQPDILK